MTLLELLIPVSLFLILALLRGQIDEGEAFTSAGKSYAPLSLLGKLEIATKDDSVCHGNMTLFYTPGGDLQNKMAEDIQRYVRLYCQQKETFTTDVSDNLEITMVENEEKIEAKYKEYKSAVQAGSESLRRVLGGIVLKNISTDMLEYQFRYGQDFDKVEAQTKDTYSRGQGFFGEYGSCQYNGSFRGYNCVEQKYRLFVTLQQLVDFAYIQAVTDDTTLLQSSGENICKFSSVRTKT
jgi:hypothetical protein